MRDEATSAAPLSDVYDALISKRVYKPSYSHDEAVAMIRQGSGSHFDPSMVDAFLEIQGEFKEIADRYVDIHEAAL